MRLEGWELRVLANIEDAKGKTYKLGRHDCFIMATNNVKAITGQDLYAPWRGKYRSELTALRLINEYSEGRGPTAAISKLLGSEPVSTKMARVGDLIEFRDAKGSHLGVCLGVETALLGESGVEYHRTLSPQCLHAWRIG